MVKVLLHGCNGRMGKVISGLIAEDEKMKVVAGVDAFDNGQNEFPVCKTIRECQVAADVVIDFSVAAAVDDLLDYCVEHNTPCVLCTTGLSEEQMNKVNESAKKVAILKSANMSMGINMLMKLLKEATRILAPAGFDIEIVEKHHNQKLDAPSGTALALGDAINEELNNEYEYVFDRSTRREKRPKKEIGYSAIRGGTIVGEHDIIFAGKDEVITFSHTAYSRTVLGNGAVQAAKFLAGKAAGMYQMSDVIEA